MSTKYSADSDSQLLDDEVAMTDHACLRYRQRTPHECDVPPQVAWRRGEDIKHPQVCQSDGEDDPPDRVRVYRHDEDWGVAFLVSQYLGDAVRAGDLIVVTVINLQGFDHGPSRAYLHSHGPHYMEGDGDD